jgi:hypothetical protein
MKFKSNRLKKFNYDINISFDEAKKLGEIVALADNQILRSIRDIQKHDIKYDKLEILYKYRDKLKRYKGKTYKSVTIKQYNDLIKKLSSKNQNNQVVTNIKEKLNNPNWQVSNQIKMIQDKINRTMFIPEYISIVMEHSKHYDYLYANGLKLNGITYKRFSCAAGQARVSTVIFCAEYIIDELEKRLNNNRNLSVPVVPSKFNAYFGLSGSATFRVSEPRFIVVKDFTNKATFMASYVTETDYDKDDIIEDKEVTLDMNRTDGMGLITYEQSSKWAKELGLDWVPSQWCVRQNFIKGMLCTFPIYDFCKTKNNNNYIVDTIYKDKNGNYIKADLRNYDVIITESQFKLWNSFNSINEYIENCHKNKLYWGVSQYTPKSPKDVLRLNYQFIQALNINKDNIDKLASLFVDWIQGVTYGNIYYMFLFLLGVNNTAESISDFLRSSDSYWIKSLIVNPELKNDKYINGKIYDLIKTKIQNGCLGEILVDGNFQVLVYDPYGFMQHVCGQTVEGLLKDGEFYSKYWNNKGVSVVDGMRSPLTFQAEHVCMKLRNDNEVNEWYRYCEQGIILNYYGHEVVNFGGADTDYDILATTSNAQIIEGICKDVLPVVYDPPKPEKIIFTKDDLFNADKFSFGSIIGQITNKSSNAYALLPLLAEKYGKDSDEYKITYSRIQQCCKAQSAQIDKAKIGREVKGIPDIWIKKREIEVDENGVVLDNDDVIKEKLLFNSILLNKYPYFFKYRYKSAKNKYKTFYEYTDITCHQKYKMSLKELMSMGDKSDEQSDFIKNYYDYCPLTDSNSSMNLLCHYIESVNFDIRNKIKVNDNVNLYIDSYKNKSVNYNKETYEKIASVVDKFLHEKSINKRAFSDNGEEEQEEDVILYDNSIEDLLNDCCSNIDIVVNCLVDYFYINKVGANKNILWDVYGKYIYKNIVKNNRNKPVYFPLPDENGNIVYLNKRYKVSEVIVK